MKKGSHLQKLQCIAKRRNVKTFRVPANSNDLLKSAGSPIQVLSSTVKNAGMNAQAPMVQPPANLMSLNPASGSGFPNQLAGILCSLSYLNEAYNMETIMPMTQQNDNTVKICAFLKSRTWVVTKHTNATTKT